MSICPYCAQDVPEAKSPWLHQRHDIFGRLIGNQATTTCVGSRNVYTLDFLGIRDIEPDRVPQRRPMRGAA